MEISKQTVRKLQGLMFFAIVILVGLWKFDMVLRVVQFLFGIIFPFILGGAIAFIINVPMSFIEKKLFSKKEKKKYVRPVSLLLTIALAIGVIALVILVVVPQLSSTFATLGASIVEFIPKVQVWVGDLTNENPEIMKTVNDIQFNPEAVMGWITSFFKNGAGNVMSSTFHFAKSLMGGIATFFIAFTFACYILIQKEKLHVQVRKVLYAMIPQHQADQSVRVCSLTYRTFASFLAGQCLEAIILGSMFVVGMTIFRMPYALLSGILIAFTALIPIFGAFIGCSVVTFLIFMVNPQQAIIFVVLFLVLQQVEGNFIYPHVVGGSVGLPSIWVLAAVSIGANLMGVIGMIIFIPAISVIYTLFREWVYIRLKEKKIEAVLADEVVYEKVEE